MIPRYGEWNERLGPSGLAVLGVHTPELERERDPRALRRFIDEHRIRWPVIVDEDQAIWSRLGVEAWPTILLIDRAGVLRAAFVGDDQAPQIEAALRRLLARE